MKKYSFKYFQNGDWDMKVSELTEEELNAEGGLQFMLEQFESNPNVELAAVLEEEEEE